MALSPVLLNTVWLQVLERFWKQLIIMLLYKEVILIPNEIQQNYID